MRNRGVVALTVSFSVLVGLMGASTAVSAEDEPALDNDFIRVDFLPQDERGDRFLGLVELLPDHKTVAVVYSPRLTGGSALVQLIDVTDSSRNVVYPAQEVRGLSLRPDAYELSLRSFDTIEMFNLKTFEKSADRTIPDSCIATISSGDGRWVACGAVNSRPGNYFASDITVEATKEDGEPTEGGLVGGFVGVGPDFADIFGTLTISFSPDSSKVAASVDGFGGRGIQVQELPNVPGSGWIINFPNEWGDAGAFYGWSPSGDILVTGFGNFDEMSSGANRIALINTTTKEVLGNAQIDVERITFVGFSPDESKMLLSYRSSGEAKKVIVSVESGALQEVEFPFEATDSDFFGPVVQDPATGESYLGWDGMLWHLDWEEGNLAFVRSLESPYRTGGLIQSVNEGTGQIGLLYPIFNLESPVDFRVVDFTERLVPGEYVEVYRGVARGELLTGFGFSRDGTAAYSFYKDPFGGIAAAQLWELGTGIGEPITLNALSASPRTGQSLEGPPLFVGLDSNIFVSAADFSAVSNVGSGVRVTRINQAEQRTEDVVRYVEGRQIGAALSNDGRTFYTVGTRGGGTEGRFRVEAFDALTGEEVSQVTVDLRPPLRATNVLGASADGVIVDVGEDTVMVIDGVTGEIRQTISLPNDAWSQLRQSKGEYLASRVVSLDGSRLIFIEQQRVPYDLEGREIDLAEVYDSEFSEESIKVIWRYTGVAYSAFLDDDSQLVTATPLSQWQDEEQSFIGRLSPAGKYLLRLDGDELRVLSPEAGSVVDSVPLRGMIPAGSTAVDFIVHPAGDKIALVVDGRSGGSFVTLVDLPERLWDSALVEVGEGVTLLQVAQRPDSLPVWLGPGVLLVVGVFTVLGWLVWVRRADGRGSHA
jgi:hypothetical protein